MAFSYRIIPRQAPYIHQGATVQRTDPIPPTSQPSTNHVLFAKNMNRFQVNVVPRFEGATIQQTHPVPETSKPRNEPELRQFEALRQMNRYIVLVVPRFEGATIQQTHPVPPVFVPNVRATESLRQSQRFQMPVVPRLETIATTVIPDVFKTNQPELRYFPKWDVNRVVLGSGNMGPDQMLDGPTIQQTHPVPGVSQPVYGWWAQREFIRQLGGPIAQFDGATIQDMLATPGGLDLDVEWIYSQKYWRPQPQLAPVYLLTNPTTPDTIPTPGVSGITLDWFLRREYARRLGGPTPQLDGATIQDTIPTPGVSGTTYDWFLRREFVRRLGGPTPQFDGATIQQTYIFPVSQPDFHFYTSTVQRYLPYPAPPQPVIITVDPRYDIYPAGQPSLAHSLNLSSYVRRLGGPTQQLDGATIQQTYIFPVSQPDFHFYQSTVQRYLPYPAPPITQIVVVDPRYDLYPANQPDMARFLLKQLNRYQVNVVPRFEGATVQDSLLIPGISGVTSDWFLRKEWARRLGGPVAQVDQGATTQQQYIFPVSQPEMIRVALKEFARRLGGPVPQLDTFVLLDWVTYPVVSQPDLRRYAAAASFRTQIEQTKRFEGAISQQTYIFPVSQPVMNYYVRITPASPWTPILGPFVSIAIQRLKFSGDTVRNASFTNETVTFPGFSNISVTLSKFNGEIVS